MNKKVHFILEGIILLVFMLLPVNAAAESWADESMSPDTLWYTKHKEQTEYILTTPQQLAGLSALVNTHGESMEGKTIKLGNNISLGHKTAGGDSVLWTPIGYYERNKKDIRFKGKFDGQNYTVDHMVVNTTTPSNGLFGATLGAEICNLTIGENSRVSTIKECTGALVGYLENSRVINCINKASVAAAKKSNVNRVGGLIGSVAGKSYVAFCVNSGSVTSAESCGGIAGGTSSSDTIVNCMNTGTVAPGYGYYAGGIVAYPYGKCLIANCINAGTVDGENCSNTGGIFGLSYNVEVRNCVNTGEVSSNKTSLGLIGGATQSTFTGFRNFSLDGMLEGSSGTNTIAVTVLDETQIKSETFANELSAYAGYLNCTDATKNLGLTEWKYNAGQYPVLTDVKAADKYKLSVVPTKLGNIERDALASDDSTSSYISEGASVSVLVTAYAGYNFSGLDVDGTFQQENTFLMPAKDITVETVFNAGSVTTWAQMAQYAEEGNDYKKADSYTYEIYTAKGLAYVTNEINSGKTNEETIINLVADIDLGVTNASDDTLRWVPAGNDTHKFNGIFDGKAFVLHNMIINNTENYAGLFGYADGAEIKNVNIGNDSKISNAGQYTGALAGYATNTKITDCHNAAYVTAVKNNIGGLVGFAGMGTDITLCSNTGDVFSENGVMLGGIAGALGDSKGTGVIYNSFNEGKISGKQTVGGLVGMLQTPNNKDLKSMIANSYNAGAVSAVSTMAGGIAGMINKYSEVKNCVNYAAVMSEKKSGGVVGSVAKDGVVIRNYYQEGLVTGNEISEDGAALSEETMKSKNLPNELSVFAGYMNNVELTDYLQWTYTSGQYPVLDAKKTKASVAYLLTVLEPVHGKAEMTAPAAVLATDSAVIFVKKNTSVTFNTTPDESYLFYVLRVNGETQVEYSNTYRTDAGNDTVEVLFSRPRRWDFLGREAVAETDYTETKKGYAIHTSRGLGWIADKVNNGDNMSGKNVYLTADIELGEKNQDGEDINWAPIGSSSSKSFKGNFDGNSYEVRNMVVNAPSGYGGLFGYAVSDTIANVTISGKSSVTGTSYLGAIAGYINTKAVIMNCNNDSCTINASTSNAGGIAGGAGSGCFVMNGSSTGAVTAPNAAGGIVGYLQGTVENCLNTGIVTATNKAGGIIGDGYNPTVLRAYRLKGCVSETVTTGNPNGVEIDEVQAKDNLLANELSAFAGYLNRTENTELAAWQLVGEQSVPAVGKEKASDAYVVTVSETSNGKVTLPRIYVDENIGFLANSGSNVKPVITPDEGFRLSVLKVNGEAVTDKKGHFTMPTEDANITAEFEVFVPETWADMAPFASEDTDYKQVDANTIEIYTAQGLAYMAALVNEGSADAGTLFKMMADIDLGVKNANGDTLKWTPAGSDTNPFTALFDGNGFTIDFMVIDSDTKYTGLFGYADGAEIKNVRIGNGSRIVSIEQYTASVAGYVNNTHIENCHNAGTVTITENKLYSGGIVGGAYGTSTIISCSNTGKITSAGGAIAGIAGALGNTKSVCELSDCSNTGEITAEKNSAGGIVGMMQGNRTGGDKSVWVTVANCVNSGNVTAASQVGGIVGFMGALSVENCVNYGKIAVNGNVENASAGAISGYLNKTVAANGGCQFFRNYTLQNSVTLAKGTIVEDAKAELTTEQLQSSGLLDELSSYAGYMNRTEDAALSAWSSDNTGNPVLTEEKAQEAYSVEIDSEINNGKILLPEMITVNDSVYFAYAGAEIVLSVLPDEDYKLAELTANDLLLTVENPSFIMPSEDVLVRAEFRNYTSVDDETITGAKVWTAGSLLYIENTEASVIYVTASDGRIVVNTEAEAGTNTYSLSDGVYIVKVNEAIYKVAIGK
ncbi:MAG: hypothetical protein PUB21_08300 [Bacteroidales bacterium]|nr:hypothetical protein [Bacteroidales bacterium]